MEWRLNENSIQFQYIRLIFATSSGPLDTDETLCKKLSIDRKRSVSALKKKSVKLD